MIPYREMPNLLFSWRSIRTIKIFSVRIYIIRKRYFCELLSKYVCRFQLMRFVSLCSVKRKAETVYDITFIVDRFFDTELISR